MQMAIQIETVPNLPVVIVTQLEAEVTEQDVLDWKAACHELYRQVGGQIYLIHDVRKIVVNFSQLVLLLSVLQRQPNRLTDLPISVYGVMGELNSVMNIGLKAIQAGQYGKMDVKVVMSVEEALTAIRQRMQLSA
jgi:hypothetical protein